MIDYREVRFGAVHGIFHHLLIQHREFSFRVTHPDSGALMVHDGVRVMLIEMSGPLHREMKVEMVNHNWEIEVVFKWPHNIMQYHGFRLKIDCGEWQVLHWQNVLAEVEWNLRSENLQWRLHHSPMSAVLPPMPSLEDAVAVTEGDPDAIERYVYGITTSTPQEDQQGILDALSWPSSTENSEIIGVYGVEEDLDDHSYLRSVDGTADNLDDEMRMTPKEGEEPFMLEDLFNRIDDVVDEHERITRGKEDHQEDNQEEEHD